MQIHHFWGIVGRRAVSYSKSSRPWEPTSEFSQMARRLQEWEANLPHEHMWSNFLLKGYKAEGQDLVGFDLCGGIPTRHGSSTDICIGISMRDHDDETVQYCPAEAVPDRVSVAEIMPLSCHHLADHHRSVIKPDPKDGQKQAFFAELSKELFRNVRQLYEQVDAQFTDRTPDESVGAQIAAFCVYSCGLFSTYICKYPKRRSSRAPIHVCGLIFD